MIALTFFAVVTLAIGLYVRFGGFKSLYLAPGIPVLMPRALQNVPIPLGITLFALLITGSDLFPDVETRRSLFDWVVIPLFLATLFLAAWPPRWLKPRWLVYLEDTYGSVMWRLLDEARKNIPAWTRRVRTQQGLEEWAEETYLRLGYPPRQAKSKEKQRNMRVRSRS